MAIRGIGGSDFGGGGSIEKQYTVEAGDTFESIAQKFGVAVNDLIQNNQQLAQTSELKAGTVLNIPAVQTPATAEAKDTLEVGSRGDIFSDALKESASPLMLQAKLTPDQFEIKPDGNLLIKNDQLSGFFSGIAGRFAQPGESLANKAAGSLLAKFTGDAATAKISDALEKKFRGESLMHKGESLMGKIAPARGEAIAFKPGVGDSLTQKVREGAEQQPGGTEKLNIKFALPNLQELNLTADQFEVDTEGNLLIKNSQLNQALQNLFTERGTSEAQTITFMASPKLKTE